MAEIIPFRALRYNTLRFGGHTPLVAPPYDVISPDYQDELYRRHRHNVVRLDFGKTLLDDDTLENRYSRATTYLRRWVEEGALIQDPEPAIYYYKVDYTTRSGDQKTMSGFISLLRLEEWDRGVVLPHEGTLKGPKVDRLELLKTTGVSASQIFSLYSDPKKVITKAFEAAITGKAPDMEALDDDGATHRVWVVTDQDVVDTARRALSDRPVFIADGHHRYETALAFRDYCRKQWSLGGNETYNYVPMFLANMDEDGLTVLPTHRLIKDAGGKKLDDIIKEASKFFDVEGIWFSDDNEPDKMREFLKRLEETGRTSHTFGFYFKGTPTFYLLKLKEKGAVRDIVGCSRSESYCNLDVTILHELIVEKVLGIDTKMIANNQQVQPVQFEKDGARAVERVSSGEFQMCFLLNATKVNEVKEVALAREIMPQKSTYFYPKLLTGLVIARIVP